MRDTATSFLLPTLIIRITRVGLQEPPANPFRDTDTEVDGMTARAASTGT